MIQIDFSTAHFKTKTSEGKQYIFDPTRKKWIILTPEEWVRQHIIAYLINIKNYSPSIIAVEKWVDVGQVKKRFDILVYDKNLNPFLMIECKSADVKLDEAAMNQILIYHSAIPVKYIAITNGKHTYAWEKNENRFNLISSLPDAIN